MPFVLHVVASLQGGGGRHVETLAKGLLKRDFTVGLLAPDDDPVLSERLKTMGVVWHTLPLDRFPNRALLRSYRRTVRELQPDIIHLHGHRAGLIGRLFMPARDLPNTHSVYTYHGYHPAHYTKPWSRVLGNSIERLFYPDTDACIAVSADTAESTASALGIDAHSLAIIPNGIELNGPVNDNQRQCARRTIQSLFPYDSTKQENFFIGTIARLQWQKGIGSLLLAWREFQKHRNAYRNQHSPYRLAIAGDGPEKAELEAFVQQEEMTDSVGFLGAVESGRSVLAGLDLFVLPSLWEGLPLTVLEAWDAGVPVLATNVEGTRGLIQHDINGFLCEPNPQTLALALSLLTGDCIRRKRYIERGSRDIRDYSADQMVERTMDIYRRWI